MGREIVGVAFPNRQISAAIKKHGVPIHSKPHGPEKTILYYEQETDEEPEEGERPENFAGKETPAAGRSTVIQKAGAGTAITSSIAGTSLRAPARANDSYAGRNRDTSKIVRDAEILNEDALDEEVEKQEKINRGEAEVEVETEKVEAPDLSKSEPAKDVDLDDDGIETGTKREPGEPAIGGAENNPNLGAATGDSGGSSKGESPKPRENRDAERTPKSETKPSSTETKSTTKSAEKPSSDKKTTSDKSSSK